MSAPSIDPRAVRRVLLVRPRFLGDICLTLPTLDAVRAACPEARVGYVVERDAAPLLASDPRIDELFTMARGSGTTEWLALAGRLRRFAPDVAFDLFCNPRSAVLVRVSGARVRVGYPDKGWRSALYTHHVRPRTLSAVGFHLASVAALGWPAAYRVPRLHLSPVAGAAADAELAHLGIPPRARIVGFHPGARWETRRWFPDRFAALARRFLDAHPRDVAVVTGGPDERALVGAIVEAIASERAIAAIGWPIERFVALQARCAAFVCGDTGPVHTAVAAGTPTLGLMSRNRPAMFFPYPESHGHTAYYARAECSPCDRDHCADLRCLKRLTVDGAWERLEGVLARGDRPGGAPAPDADAGAERAAGAARARLSL